MKVFLHQRHRVVETDDNVGLAVAVGIALDPGVGAALDEVQGWICLTIRSEDHSPQ
jgi:hypothetical protein